MNSLIFEMFEVKIFVFKLSFKWDGSGYTKIYKIGGLAKILSVVDAYPKLAYARQYFFLDEASNKIPGRKNHFEKNQKLKKNASLNKAHREQELLCGIYIGFGTNVYAVEEPF
jgi:hypothetical protein